MLVLEKAINITIMTRVMKLDSNLVDLRRGKYNMLTNFRRPLPIRRRRKHSSWGHTLDDV